MKIPQLEKKPELKSCHNVNWEDNYSWVHQSNILEVLKDSSKLIPEVRNYLEKENAYTEHHLKNTKDIQKKLFDEIKGRIKLDDESLPYKDVQYEYWTKTTIKGNYSIKLRKKIGVADSCGSCIETTESIIQKKTKDIEKILQFLKQKIWLKCLMK